MFGFWPLGGAPLGGQIDTPTATQGGHWAPVAHESRRREERAARKRQEDVDRALRQALGLEPAEEIVVPLYPLEWDDEEVILLIS